METQEDRDTMMRVLRHMRSHDPDLVMMLALRLKMTPQEVEASLDELQQHGYIDRFWEDVGDGDLRQVYRPMLPVKRKKSRR